MLRINNFNNLFNFNNLINFNNLFNINNFNNNKLKPKKSAPNNNGLKVVIMSARRLQNMAHKAGRVLDRMTLADHETLLAHMLVVGKTLFCSPAPVSGDERRRAIKWVRLYARQIATQKSSKRSCAIGPKQEAA